MRINFQALTIKQLRRLMELCGKNHAGMDRRKLVSTLNAMIGQQD